MTKISRILTHLCALVLLWVPHVWAQQPVEPPAVPYTPAEVRLRGYEQRLKLQEESLVKNVAFRNVGPTVMSGRVVDVDVNPEDPSIFYTAYASGGLWKTTSNGTHFVPLFDTLAVMTLGDIAVDWKHGEIIWAGTGENNSSRSSYAGTGIYRSADGGKTWEYRGLAETHHIGRIVLHPDNPDVVWVAAVGHLYSPNPERGVYKTTDGGKTWRRTLYIDDNTGAIDLVRDPGNPDILYAAMWHRERRAWNFVEGGKTSGIFKSTDGGETWERLNVEGSGFPADEGVGRIGLDIFPGNPQVLYAVLDNQNLRPEKKEEEKGLTREQLRTMRVEDFLKLDPRLIEEFLRRNDFPAEYTAEKVLEMVRSGKIKPVDLVNYLEDANRALFDRPVIGAEVYRSDDGGKTWYRTHEGYLDDVFYSYGYYFGQIRIDPQDDKHIYLMGVPILESEDGGKTFQSIGRENVHVDHHALWVNPYRRGHLVNGNDGGLNISYDDGRSWYKVNVIPVGQFYSVAIDMEKPYNVYGGLQDNGVWYGPSTYRYSMAWYAEGHYPYKRLLGGDGMQVQVDWRNNAIVYTGFQFGNYFRVDKRTGRRVSIKPRHKLGERPLRFNWQSPIHLSRHNQDILYFGSNRFHRSLDRGDHWETLSGDLTRGGRKGDVPYGTLTTIDESPLKFGLIYVGSDDGLVHVTRDGGNTWERIFDTAPLELWVSRVEASHHDTATVYIALNGYRWDNFEPYLYRSRDYGKTWERLGADLPPEPINVVREDPENPRVLYVGTDHGVYLSLDGGAHFMGMKKGLSHAPVHDLVVHPRDKELVVGTHGRSIFIASVRHIQQLTPEVLAKPLHVFSLDPVMYNENWGRTFSTWRKPMEPSIEIPFFAGEDGEARIRIFYEDQLMKAWEVSVDKGLNYVPYDLSTDSLALVSMLKATKQSREIKAADNGKFYLLPGTYTVEVQLHGVTERTALEIRQPKQRNR